MSAVSSKPRMAPVRRRQLILLFSLAIIVAAIALVAGILGTPAKKPVSAVRAQESTRKLFGSVAGEQINNADYWRTQEGARVSTLEAELREMREQLKLTQRRIEDDKKLAADGAEKKSAEEKRLAEAKAAQESTAGTNTTKPPSAPPGGLPPRGDLGDPSSGGMPTMVVRPIVRINMSSADGAVAKAGATPGKAGSVTGPSRGDGGGDVRGDGNTAESYIPSGSFMRGFLLSGLDAPTGGQAQQNPHPVLIEVSDMASLPNQFKADYKHCRLVANGAGDLSSERALIRLDRMSCVAEDGGTIDIGVKGYVTDSTGKAGVRGRLVSKQGSVLANALIAGVASGIGNAFANGAMTTSSSPLGTTTAVKDGTASQFQAGLGTGVGSALNELSRYYIQLAEKMFPVVEVDAGQPIDIVITKGFSIARR